jgi:hypothetical protein
MDISRCFERQEIALTGQLQAINNRHRWTGDVTRRAVKAQQKWRLCCLSTST